MRKTSPSHKHALNVLSDPADQYASDQGPSLGLAVSLVSLVPVLPQTCCFYRRHTCATSAFCASEAVHRKVCWLTCCVRKDRRLHTELRFALVSELAHVPGPTDTYRPHCRLAASLQALLWGLHQYRLDEVSEVIVVDWVSSKEMQPLFDTPELTKVWQHYTKFGSRTKVRTLTIYQEDTLAFVVDPLQRLSEVHALNAAAQRARGSILLRLDQDTLVGTSFLRFLANEKEAAWPHHHQPWFAGRRECDPQQSDEVIRDPVKFISDAGDNVVSGDGSSHEHFMGGPVGIVGLPAWLWRLVQGYNERYVKWGHVEHELF